MKFRIKAGAIAKVRETIDLASKLYNRDFTYPKVTFNRKGRTAGMAYSYVWKVMLNLVLLSENYEDFMEQTIPHEVAHLVANKCFNSWGHDREWKRVMRDFGLVPLRYNSYDLRNVCVGGCYIYKCGCHEYQASKQWHNVANERGYYCTKCGKMFKFTGEMM